MDNENLGFEKLEVWQFCRGLRKEIEDVAFSFPKEEKYRLSDQMVRAARSVTNNIAEGYGRFHYQEYIQFLRVSRGSLNELADDLIIANDNDYIEEPLFKVLKMKCTRAVKMLNGFIRYLKEQKHNNKNS